MRALSLAVSFLLLTAAASAQTSNWTGTSSNSWAIPSNWDNGVPNASTNAVIPASATTFPAIYVGNPVCNSLTIQTGASMTLTSGWDLTVNGNLIVAGTLTVSSSSSNITVAGGWTNNGTFTHGNSTVTLSGTGTLAGSSTTTFNNLTISGGTRNVAAAFAVAGDAEVINTATLNTGTGLTHTVVGNWTSTDAGVSITGTGTIEFTGDGFLTTLSTTLPGVLVSGGTRSVNTSSIAGDLDMTGGTLDILDSTTLSVAGDANLSGGTLAWTSSFAGQEILDVEGNVTLTAAAGSTSVDALLRCGGDWSSTSAFSPASGTVELDGAGTNTVGGASPTFAQLLIAAGTKNVTSATTVIGDVTVASGALLDTDAVLDVTGDVILSGVSGTAWDAGTSTHTIEGGLSSSGADVIGAGMLQFDGASDRSVASTGGDINVPSLMVTSAKSLLFDLTVNGDLSMTGGEIELFNNTTITVTGDANLTGGTLSFKDTSAGLETLDVAGNITLTAAAGAMTVSSRIECSGDFTSTAAWTPTDGTVTLDGTTQTLSGTDFVNLTVETGTANAIVPATITGNMNVLSGATMAAGAALDIGGNVNLGDGTAGFDLGSDTHTVAGSYNSAGASATGAGSLDFDGTGTLATGGGSISNAVISAGTRTISNAAIANLTMTAGTLIVADDQTVSVSGNLVLSGGTLDFPATATGSADVIDVEGDATITATAGSMNALAAIRVAGSWSSTSAWTPTAGAVELDGVSGTVGGASPTFFDLAVAAGTYTTSTAVAVTNDLSVASGADLVSGGAISVGNAVALGDGTAGWDLATFTHDVTGDYTSAGGSATGTGTVEFTGTGSVATGGGAIANVLVSGGTRAAGTTDIAGDLDLTGGVLDIGDDAIVSVGGNAGLSAGTLQWTTAVAGVEDVLDVAGDATVTAAFGGGSSLSRFRVAGNWSSSAAFTPTDGLVELDGGGAATIGGASPTFNDLDVVDGAKTLTSATSVAGDLTIAAAHSLTLSGASIDVSGDIVVEGTFDLGGQTVTVTGSWTSNAGTASIIGGGALDCTGSGVLTSGINPLPSVTVSGGVRSVFDATIAGTLDLTAGNLVIQDNSTVAVSGAASLTGGTLDFDDTSAGLETLDVNGGCNVTAAAGTTSANSRFHCAGNWTSNATFAPALGQVVLDGGTTTTFGGTAPSVANLRIASGDKAITVATTILEDLIVDSGAALTSNAVLAIGDDVVLGDGTSSWNIGALTQPVVNDLTSTGGSVTGTGTIDFTAGGTLATGTGSIPNLLNSGGIRLCNTSNITGNADMTAGNLRINNDALLSVAGDLTVTGGVLEWSPSPSGIVDVLDVDGNATVNGSSGFTSVNTRFRVAGNYSAGASFTPEFGTVELDGGTTTTVSGTPTFPTLTIVSGTKTITVPALVDGSLGVSDGATLDTDGVLTVTGGTGLGNGTASWDTGALTHVLGGALTSTGASATGGGTLQLTGNGQVNLGGGTVDNLLVTGGDHNLTNVTVTGDLAMTGGSIDVQNNQTVSIGGDLALTAGTLDFTNTSAGAETIDVTGNVTMTATAGAMTATSTIEVEGNWSANGNWTPINGTVRLDGAGITQLTGLAGDFELDFSNLEIVGGIREVANDLTLDIDTLLVDSASELRLADKSVTVPGSTLTIDGRLDIDAGGDLSMGSTALMTISPSGTLSMIGVVGDQAAITGTGGGGYTLIVNGTIEANHFHFGGMGSNGVIISNTATIAADPLDMRVGLFDDPSAQPNSVMLNISRSVATEFRYVDFEDVGGVGTFNVTALFGSPITFANSNGGFAGEAFDNDPFNLVNWVTDTTGIVDFFATAGLGQVTLDWETYIEVDSQDFVMMRADNFGGPFSNIGELPSIGPTTYQIVDNTVTPGQFYVYQLFERLTNDDLHFIAQRTATPWSAALPANVLDVGASGTYADIGTALASIATLNPIIMIEPGTYPPFTVTSGFLGTLRIYADGTGPVIIDTTTGPVVFDSLDVSSKVDVGGLTIGSAGTAFAGVEVNDCDGLVILDECIITGGVSQPGVSADNSDRLAMTRCDTAGTPGILLFNGSTAIAGNGTLDDTDVQDTSSLRTAGLTYGSTVAGTADLLDFGAGPHADIDVERFIPLNTTFTMTFSGFPNSFWGIFLSFDIGWADLYSAGQLAHEMVPMADLGLGSLLAVLPFGPSGSIPINGTLPAEGSILGLPIIVTILNGDPGSGNFRWSNVVSLIGMPQ